MITNPADYRVTVTDTTTGEITHDGHFPTLVEAEEDYKAVMCRESVGPSSSLMLCQIEVTTTAVYKKGYRYGTI